MNYWKIMPGRGAQYVDDFLTEGVVRIGFVDSPDMAQASMDTLRVELRDQNPEQTERQISTSANQVYKFFHDIQAGDRMVMFHPGTRNYHIGEVVDGEVRYDADHQLRYMRKVTWTATVPRDMLPVDARNSLGAILTLFSVSDDAVTAIEQALSDEFPVVTERIEENDIADAGEDVIEKAREFVKDTLQNLNWNDMEQLVAGLLRAMGYRATVSPVGPDRGRGIIASPDGLGLEDPRIVVEVKHRKGTIGAPEVRAFVGGLRRAKGVYVSTGGFTREAQYEADRSETPLTLVDIDALARLVEQYYDQFDNDARAILPLRKVYWPL